jgi:hypothetical protein
MTRKSPSLVCASLAVGLLSGCGGEPAGEDWCTSTADCDPGYYCDPQIALCAQDCTSKADCPDDQECNESGQCVEGQDTDTGTQGVDPCGDPVLLVVDRSRSMHTNGNWDSLVAAISDVVHSFELDVDFGLLVFPDDSCVDNYSGTDLGKLCRGPDNTTVDIGPNAADSIEGSLESLGTCGGTPISAALAKAAQVLGLTGGNAQVVLVTDGLPNCNTSISIDDCECLLAPPQSCDGNTQHCLDMALSVERAGAILELDSALHVLPFAMTADHVALFDELAEAGGTGLAIPCADGDGLAGALTTIFTTITDC